MTPSFLACYDLWISLFPQPGQKIDLLRGGEYVLKTGHAAQALANLIVIGVGMSQDRLFHQTRPRVPPHGLGSVAVGAVGGIEALAPAGIAAGDRSGHSGIRAFQRFDGPKRASPGRRKWVLIGEMTCQVSENRGRWASTGRAAPQETIFSISAFH